MEWVPRLRGNERVGVRELTRRFGLVCQRTHLICKKKKLSVVGACSPSNGEVEWEKLVT